MKLLYELIQVWLDGPFKIWYIHQNKRLYTYMDSFYSHWDWDSIADGILGFLFG